MSTRQHGTHKSGHRKTGKTRRRRAPKRAVIIACALGASLIIAAALMSGPQAGDWAHLLPLSNISAILIAAGGFFMALTVCFLRRRPAGLVYAFVTLGITVAALGVAVQLSAVGFGWRLVPVSARTVDLRGQGIRDLTPIRRLSALETAVLSDNQISDITPLKNLENLTYADLTGNPVTEASAREVRLSRPDCLIFSSAKDTETRHIRLSGQTLPPMEALCEALAACEALEVVDCRGSSLSDEEVAALQARLPQVRFMDARVNAEGRLIMDCVSADDAMTALGALSNGQSVTLTGVIFSPEEYSAILARYPDLSMTCQVLIYGRSWPTDAAFIDMSACAVDERLGEYLALFPNMSVLYLPEYDPCAAQSLMATHPGVTLTYKVGGITVDAQTTEISLKGRGAPQADYIVALAQTAPSLKRVYTDTLSADERSALDALGTGLSFVCDIEVLGLTVPSDATVIDFGSRAVTEDEIPQLESVFGMLENLERVNMFESHLSHDTMDRLFDTYPDLFFGWTFELCNGKWVVRSDVTAFSCLNDTITPRWESYRFVDLRYCKNLLALDLGHNYIRDISFLSNFPHLKVLILADNEISDISVLSELPDLEYVELFLNEFWDLSPLMGHDHLLDLNLSYCFAPGTLNASMFEPLCSLTSLERLWMLGSRVTDVYQQQLRRALPHCQFYFAPKGGATSGDWRFHPRYDVVNEMFTTGTYIPFN